MYLSLSIFFLCFFVAVSNAERDFSFDNQALDSQSSTLPTLKGWLKANGVDMRQKIAAHRNGTKTATKSALRSVKPKDSTLLEGSLEIGYYGNEECEGPVLSKLIIPANGCFEDVDYYMKITLVKDGYAPGVDKLRVTYQKEEDCSDEGTYPVEIPVRYHKCYNKGTRAVYRPTLPTPAEVDLPVLIATYQGNTACLRNDGQTGLREVVYFRKNFCVRGYGGDKFIAGCDTKGRLVMTYYPSRDGTCRNGEGRDESYTERKIQNGEDCLDDFYLSDFGLVGFLNFRCRK